jgi:hypothetical protein
MNQLAGAELTNWYNYEEFQRLISTDRINDKNIKE